MPRSVLIVPSCYAVGLGFATSAAGAPEPNKCAAPCVQTEEIEDGAVATDKLAPGLVWDSVNPILVAKRGGDFTGPVDAVDTIATALPAADGSDPGVADTGADGPEERPPRPYETVTYNATLEIGMTAINQLAEQHIREHAARLKHIDELLERARQSAGAEPVEVQKKLSALAQERDKLARRVEEMRLKSLDDWREEEIAKAGPLAVWDAVAQQLEKLVERLER